jgi:excisionase family DNA binding protein
LARGRDPRFVFVVGLSVGKFPARGPHWAERRDLEQIDHGDRKSAVSIEDQIRAAVREEIAEVLSPYLRRLCQPEPRTYSVPQVAKILCLDPRTVETMIDRGDLPTVPLNTGRKPLVPRAAIDALLPPPPG